MKKCLLEAITLFLVAAIGCDDGGSSSGKARTWRGAEIVETYNATDAYYPEVDCNSRGDVFAVWRQKTGATDGNIWFNRYINGPGWGLEGALKGDADINEYNPDIAVDEEGNAIAVWMSYNSDDSVYDTVAMRYKYGYGWGETELIEISNAGSVAFPAIAMDPEGNAIAVWYQADSGLTSIWANRYANGSGWETAVLIESDDTANAVYPRVAMDAEGNAIAVWTQSDATRYNIWANRYVKGTGWGTAEPLETYNFGDALYPQISMDYEGNAIALWYQSTGSGVTDIVSNRYVNGSGWGTAGVIDSDNAGNADAPRIAVNARGDAIAVWRQSDATRYNIWANRYTRGFGWGGAGEIETENLGDADDPQIVIDSGGNAVAVWQQYDGSQYNIQANRYSARNGWGAAVYLETDNSGYAEHPRIAMDAGGNAVVVWHQDDGTRYNIMANYYR